MIKTTLSTSIALIALAAQLSAETVFVFGNVTDAGQAQADLLGLETGSTVSDGITLTATVGSGVFHATGSGGFGINATATDDATTQFDFSPTDGADFMTISFDTDVEFASIFLTSFGGSDEAFLTIGATTVTIDNGSFNFAPGTVLAANTEATFGYQAGNGFELASLTLVPEPATSAFLFGAGGLALALIRRRPRK